ncbi:hypothetical protein [Suttonella ornithocola]|uniref:Uncharacterized protein n=1 Tax=Suttonella ornithocola TaxID=279832 RepID=A0A380MT82_9GAMM|nr:hypothetical protein [Suttonella ornithocola]SUO95488.1 Uncharacterised protein [Suttonella ornithocola]
MKNFFSSSYFFRFYSLKKRLSLFFIINILTLSTAMAEDERDFSISVGRVGTLAEIEQSINDDLQILDNLKDKKYSEELSGMYRLVQQHLLWLFQEMAVNSDYKLLVPSNLEKHPLITIATAPDNNLRWYSWYIPERGTMANFGSVAHFTNTTSRLYHTFNDLSQADFLDACCDIRGDTYRIEKVMVDNEPIYLRFTKKTHSRSLSSHEIKAYKLGYKDPKFLDGATLLPYPLFIEKADQPPTVLIRIELDNITHSTANEEWSFEEDKNTGQAKLHFPLGEQSLKIMQNGSGFDFYQHKETLLPNAFVELNFNGEHFILNPKPIFIKN